MDFLILFGVLAVIVFIAFLMIGGAVAIFSPTPGSGSRSDIKAQAAADDRIHQAFGGGRDMVTFDVWTHQAYPSRGELIEKAHSLGYSLTGSSDSGSVSTLVFELRDEGGRRESTMRAAARPRLRPDH